MKTFTADYVLPICADPIKNGIVTVDDDGKILSVTDPYTAAGKPPNASEHLSGIICPGFVNTHCHLELSHLKDKIPTGGGLISFIQQLQSIRQVPELEVVEAARRADQEMFENGIVAVGDISNNNVTIDIKAKSKLYYHTFIEVFGFLPERAEEIFERALQLEQQFKPQSVSVTPHAPYSVSKNLFKLIKKYSEGSKNLLSVHNQESEEENKFYRYKLGQFLDLYEGFGIDISYFKPQARNSVQSIIPLLSSKQNILLVHNTCTSLKDIYFIKRFDRKIHWCFCPGANLYIEGKLPKIELFIDQGFNITLGTDSLASNTGLSILNEIFTIQRSFPSIELTKLIEWGTLGGARYLGIDDRFGTIEIGKTPGLNLITNVDDMRLTAESKVVRLV